jgi:hypothetical protein
LVPRTLTKRVKTFPRSPIKTLTEKVKQMQKSPERFPTSCAVCWHEFNISPSIAMLFGVNRLEKSPMLFTRETTYQQALEYRETAKRALLNDVVVRHMVSRIRHSIEAAARGSYPRDEAMIDTAYLLLAYAEHVKAAR